MHTHTLVCIHTHISMHIHAHICIHTHAHTHIHICTCIHICIHTLTHAQVNATSKSKQHNIKGTITCKAVTYNGKVLREDVETVKIDLKVNEGKTEQISVDVDGSIFSEFPGTKVWLIFPNRGMATGTGTC